MTDTAPPRPPSRRTGDPPRRWLDPRRALRLGVRRRARRHDRQRRPPDAGPELGATTSQLQWIVDSYVLVFAGLLMAAGSLGDRFGRKGVMQIGLALFAVVLRPRRAVATARRADRLAGRHGHRRRPDVPGHAGHPRQRLHRRRRSGPTAIAVWAATAGLAVALGPVTGGFLLEHFWWGSVLMINVPVIAVALVAIARVVPTSRDTTIHRFDPLGTRGCRSPASASSCGP